MSLQTLDEIVPALYACISGPAGPRDWRALADLFLPGAQLVRIPAESEGRAAPVSRSVDEFCREAEVYVAQNPFYESEVARQTATFGQVAHVLSAYEARHSPHGPVIARGIHSIQLCYDGARWWVASLVWDDERPGRPLVITTHTGGATA